MDPRILFDVFESAVAVHPKRPAVISAGGALSYERLLRNVEVVARNIQQAGLPSGSLVSIEGSSPESIAALIACWALELPALMGPPGAGEDGDLAIAASVDEGGVLRTAQGDRAQVVGDGSLVLRTSGTTGDPKPVLHSAAGLLNGVLGTASLQAEALGLPIHPSSTDAAESAHRLVGLQQESPGMTFYSAMPLDSIAGVVIVIRALLLGDAVVVDRGFEPGRWVDLVRTWGVTSSSMSKRSNAST